MFYIIGHKFKVTGQTSNNLMRSRSITQKLNVLQTQQRNPKTDISNTIGEIDGMIIGKHYELLRIKTLKDINKIRYIFKLCDNSNQIITKDFESTSEADAFIAKVSGDIEKLNSLKILAQNSYEGSSI